MVLVHKAYKFQIYPNAEQKIRIAKTMGCSRFVFNYFLAKWNDRYKETGKGFTYGTCSSQLPALKKEFVWFKEVTARLFNLLFTTSLTRIHDSSTNKTKHLGLSQKTIKFNHIQRSAQMGTSRL